MRSRWPPLNTRVLTAILLAGLPVLAIGTAVVLGIGRARLKEAEGARLAQMAEYIAGTVDAYVFRSILDTAVLARVPTIREAAAEGNKRPFDDGAAEELDRRWRSDRTGISRESRVLESATSRFLADLTRNDSVKREILVTDRYGRLVAASNITSDYLQADEEWWQEAFDGGHGRVSVTDVRRDESAGVYAFEIAVPVPAPSSDEIAGVMKIVMDSREMLADVGGAEFGATAEAMLVRPNGSIVFSRRPHTEGDRFFAADLMREALEARAQRKGGNGPIRFDAGAEEGTTRLVVLAPSQLGRNYPGLAWYVALSVSQDELLAPFQSLLWYLMAAFALTALAVLAIALWLSLRLGAPAIDAAVDMHLVDHGYTHTDAGGDGEPSTPATR
jgi:hypothetical protein